jgi:omega-amidase
MQDLILRLIQTPLHWQEPESNRAMLEEKLWQMTGPVDVVILPEMFTTGFTMNPDPVAEVMHMATLKWMKQMAAQLGAVVTGSYIVKESNQYYNRLIWMEPAGAFAQYDKRHLFRMAGEHQHYGAGNQRLVVEWKGWQICPLICYDLRFPVWSRNVTPGMKAPAYDLLLFVANWPEPRVSAWDALLKARAIENLSYVAGVNRIGTDGNSVSYVGHSAVYGPKGEVLWEGRHEEVQGEVRLSGLELIQYREKFPAYLDADGFELK